MKNANLTVFFEHDDVPLVAEVAYKPGRQAPKTADHDAPGFAVPADPSECEIVTVGLAQVSLNGRYAPLKDATQSDWREIKELAHQAADKEWEAHQRHD